MMYPSSWFNNDQLMANLVSSILSTIPSSYTPPNQNYFEAKSRRCIVLTGKYFRLCIPKSVPIFLLRNLIKATLLDHPQGSGFRAFATGCCDASGVWITQTTAQLSLSHFYFSFWPCGFWDLSSPIRD